MACLKPVVQTLCSPCARRWGFITKKEYDAEVRVLQREEKYSQFLRTYWKKELDKLKNKIAAIEGIQDGQDDQGNQGTVGKGQDGKRTRVDQRCRTSTTTRTS